MRHFYEDDRNIFTVCNSKKKSFCIEFITGISFHTILRGKAFSKK